MDDEKSADGFLLRGFLRIIEVITWAVVWAQLLIRIALAVAIPLVVLYALVRFVKWAWTN